MGWISVKDKLPEQDQNVIFVVYAEDSRMFNHLHGEVLAGWFKQYDKHCVFNIPGLGLTASHWMPAPKPPRDVIYCHGEKENGDETK